MYPHDRHSRLFNAKKNNTDFSMCLFFWSKKALVSSIGIVVVGKSIKGKSIQQFSLFAHKKTETTFYALLNKSNILSRYYWNSFRYVHDKCKNNF
jgi:hypothetical protein